MRKVRLRVIRDERFKLVPASVGIADAFTTRAYPQQTAKICQFPLPGFVGGFLRFDSLRYVDTAPDITEKLAVVKKRHATVENPSICPITPLQPVLHLEDFTFGEGFQVRVQTALEIVGVNAFSPLISDLLFHGAAAKLQPTVVEVVAFRGWIGAPDHDGRLLDNEFVLC